MEEKGKRRGVQVKGRERESWREGFGLPKNFGVAPPMVHHGGSLQQTSGITFPSISPTASLHHHIVRALAGQS